MGSGPPPSTIRCSVDNCGGLHEARGYCRKHYLRWYRHGDPRTVIVLKTPVGVAERWIEEHLFFDGGGCLPWPFYRSKDGRGIASRDGKPVLASRVMCEMANGPPPSLRHHAAHSCGKAHQACVHPKHLIWKTPIENEADKIGHGTKLFGERHHQAKLTEQQVRDIRAASGTLYEIGANFGISYSNAGLIRQRKTWRHVA